MARVHGMAETGAAARDIAKATGTAFGDDAIGDIMTKYDKDGNGVLDYNELRESLRRDDIELAAELRDGAARASRPARASGRRPRAASGTRRVLREGRQSCMTQGERVSERCLCVDLSRVQW